MPEFLFQKYFNLLLRKNVDKKLVMKEKKKKIPARAGKSLFLRIGLAQINPTVGDLKGNLRKIIQWAKRAERAGVELLVFPELVLTGYPPEDLLLQRGFIQDNLKALKKLVRSSAQLKPVLLVGFVDQERDNYNACAVIQKGRLRAVYHKRYLPNYGVFDEDRYFKPGDRPLILEWGEVRVGVTICEDLWYPEGAEIGEVELIINLSSSPYHYQKAEFRQRLFATRASDQQAILAFCNLVGGQDELVFDGGSMIFNPEGEVIARAKSFEEDLLVADLDLSQVLHFRLKEPRVRKQKELERAEQLAQRVILSQPPFARRVRRKLIPNRIEPGPEGVEEVFQALVLGTRDYVRKNGFKKVVLGLSGGIDSSLVACIAVEALGKDSVVGVSMPSQYTSRGTRSDAQKLAENLGIKFYLLPIQRIFQAYLETLAEVFKGKPPDVTEENIQARIRGNLLMALSNKFGWLVLTTGNKSEIATGYCTLYGDMAGGFAVIKDVPKTMVYQLARFYNQRKKRAVIPKTVLTRPPSAELRPDQTDQDTLPAYEELDPILQGYVVEDFSYEELIAQGHKPEVVRRVIQMVDRNEYKRRQAPPGIKITPRAFGRDWRLPITNHYQPGRWSGK